MIGLLVNKWFAGAAAALALIIGAYIWLGVHDRAQQAIGEARCQAKIAQALAQAKQEQEAAQAAYAKRLEAINDQYERDLAAIPARVVSTPIILHNGQVCAATVSAPTAETGDQPAGAGGTVGGDGSNIRPAVEAFKGRLETLVAQCRRMADAWPK